MSDDGETRLIERPVAAKRFSWDEVVSMGEAGLQEPWIVDPATQRIWIRRGPAPERWRSAQALDAGEPVSALCVPGEAFDPAVLPGPET
jgi:Uma2 family endonuclease